MPASACFPEPIDPSDSHSVHPRDNPGETISWQRFSVPFEFPVVFTRQLFDVANASLVDAVSRREPDKCHRLIVFMDSGVAAACPELAKHIERYCQVHAAKLRLVAEPIVVTGGEAIKSSWEGLAPFHQRLQDEDIDRHSFVIAIGGGAVLDAIGLVAATAHRGIRHIRIPTTVLSQNDSGVGVKNGINQFDRKNWLGTFAPPWAVLNDSAFIDVLDPREKRAGMAEAVKVALIRDGAFFDWLSGHADALARFERDAMDSMIRRCAELHMHQIGQGGDPFELGSARPLDFGHWAAHRLETLTAHDIRHGEAVAIGIALDTTYSELAGHLDALSSRRVLDLMSRLGFALWHPALEQRGDDGRRSLLSGLDDFQAHLGGELTVTLLSALGVGVEVHQIDTEQVEMALQRLEKSSRSKLC